MVSVKIKLERKFWIILAALIYIVLAYCSTLVRSPSYVVSQIFYGFLNGAMYALASIGFIMGITVSRFINIFHGELIILGGYIVYWLSIWCHSDALYFIPVAAGILFSAGMVLFRSPFGTINEKAHVEHRIGPAVIIAFGLSVLLQNSMSNIWSIDTRIIRTGQTVYDLFGIKVPEARLTSSLVSVVLLIGIWAFLKFTRTGKAFRAISQDPNAAQSVGINTRKLGMICFGLASATGGISGGLLGRVYPFNPYSGFLYMQKMGVILLLGGLSVIGSLIAGILFGILEGFIICLLGIYYRDMLGGVAFILIIALQQFIRSKGS